MKYLDLTLPTPVENLACDEALLDWCEEGGGPEALRFWEPREHFVVLGYANKIASEVALPVCEARDIPVLRRCTGGGTVLQGPGCLNYTLVLEVQKRGPLQSIAATNKFILERNRCALEPIVQSHIAIQGDTDLTIGPLKFSGNSQRRRRKFLLFHGTFLLQFDLPLIGQCLLMPSRQPDYRRHRPHHEFVMNLNVRPGLIKAALQEIWQATSPLEEIPEQKIRDLARQKYLTKEWISRL